MGLFDKIKEPVFMKESSSAEDRLQALKLLLPQVSQELQKKIEREIKIVEAGIYGEKQILYELKNSHMPMIVLHDLYLECDGCTAQIDYLILTRGRQFILECKNLIGNIEIDANGNFFRHLSNGKNIYREAFYSPITQNRHHLELIKQIRMKTKKNILAKRAFEKDFPEAYRSIVVLANAKTILDAKDAKKELQNQVIRADQLIAYIREANEESDAPLLSEKEMVKLAKFFMDNHKQNPTDYVAKYKETVEKQSEEESFTFATKGEVEKEKEEHADVDLDKEENEELVPVLCPRCGAMMVKRMAMRGSNAGKEFYGCSNYPRCKGIVNIAE